MDLLRKATGLIGERIGRITGKSPVFETPPWGFDDPVPFYNCVIELRSRMSPQEVLSEILRIEELLGRRREEPGQNAPGPSGYLPRMIDIDLLFYNDLILSSHDLVIPHPAIAVRRFVLEPLNRVCPSFIHPVTNMPISELLQKCADPSILTQVGEV
jgi:2-amino-4-hydroxy-6-hydroxymethyldihydropteridine diphosphokinase